MIEPLSILFEDLHCLAVAKPAGVLTQGKAGREPTLEDAVRDHLNPDDPASVYLGTVHRLDRPVSGVVLWAKTARAARRLAEQFARREARKEYWAIVAGSPSTEEGTWDDWLGPADTEGRVQVVDEGAPGGRRALTRFRKGEAPDLPADRTWLRLWPETGRTHQIRVQAAARGLPILGDQTYGSTTPFPRGIALHARALTILHPILRRPMTFETPPAWPFAGLNG